jgi:uncharacterized membrane protein (DUF4010 family)
MKRLLLALIFGMFAYAIAFASAATIGTVTDAGLGAGNAVVAACDTDGVTVGYTTAYTSNVGYTVSQVNITGIAAACDNKAVKVTLTKANGTGNVEGTGTVTPSGSANVAVSNGPAAVDVEKVFIEIGAA